MANTGFFHHVGTFLLFAACILLIVASVSAPVVDHLALLRVRLANATASHPSALTFGPFGYCLLDAAAGAGADGSGSHTYCSRHTVGYSPAALLQAVNGGATAAFSADQVKTAHGLTRALVLHPVGAGLAFLAFVLAAGAGVLGSLLAALVAALAALVALVVLIVDFVLFRMLRDHANGGSNNNSSGQGHPAHFGVAIWLVVAATAALVLGACVVFLSCCSARLHRRTAPRAPAAKADAYVVPATRRRRRRFWERR